MDKVIYAGVVDMLEEAADTVAQRKAWVNGEPIAFPSPVELLCQLFDDTGLGDGLESGIVFSEAIDKRLRRLASLGQRIDVDLAPEELLRSDTWNEFSRDAAEIRKVLMDWSLSKNSE